MRSPHKSTKILTLLLILSLCGNGIQTGIIKQLKDNGEAYTTQLRDNFNKRELGYKLRIDAISRASQEMGLRTDSVTTLHHDLLRKDSLRTLEIARIKGRFDKLTADQMRAKMIDEYEQNKR